MYLEKKMIYNLERDEYKICSAFFSMQMKCFLVNLCKSQKSQIRNFFLDNILHLFMVVRHSKFFVPRMFEILSFDLKNYF